MIEKNTGQSYTCVSVLLVQWVRVSAVKKEDKTMTHMSANFVLRSFIFFSGETISLLITRESSRARDVRGSPTGCE